MRAAALTGPQGRTRRAGRSHPRARSLENWLTTLRHDLPRRRTGRRTSGRRINRTRSGLRNNEPPRRRHGLRWTGYNGRSSSRCDRLFGCSRRRGTRSWCLRCRRRGRGADFDRRRSCDFGLLCDLDFRLIEHRCGRAFDRCLSRFGDLMRRARVRYRRRGRLGRSDNGRRRTWHRLRRDETRCGLAFNRRRRRARRRCYRFWRHSRGRRNDGLGWRRCRRARWRSRLRDALGDRFQHIARLGNVREVDLRLELIRRSGKRAHPARRGWRLLGKILLDALGFVVLNRAGVRLLLGDADLG